MQKLAIFVVTYQKRNFIEELVNLARSSTGNIDQFISNAGYADKKNLENLIMMILIDQFKLWQYPFQKL